LGERAKDEIVSEEEKEEGEHRRKEERESERVRELVGVRETER